MHSASVFTSESGQPVDPPFDRNFISKELNIMEDNTSNKIPLLYSILFGLKKEAYEPNSSYNNYPQQGVTNQVRNNNSSDFNSKNKFKDQSINMNLNSNNGNSMTKDKNYFNNKTDQPQPWIID